MVSNTLPDIHLTTFPYFASIQEKIGVPDVSKGLHIMENHNRLSVVTYQILMCSYQSPVTRQTPSLMYMPLPSIRISSFSTKV